MVKVLQAMHSRRKGCVLFVVHISSDKSKDVEDVKVLRRYLILAVLGCDSNRDFIFSTSHRSGIFH